MKYRIVQIIDCFYIQRTKWFWGWQYLYIDYNGLCIWKSDPTSCECFSSADEAEVFFRDKLIPKVIKIL